MRLVLASASPRRLDLLARIGIAPDAVMPADVDESVPTRELPRDHALRLAFIPARGGTFIQCFSIRLARSSMARPRSRGGPHQPM